MIAFETHTEWHNFRNESSKLPPNIFGLEKVNLYFGWKLISYHTYHICLL